MARMIDPSALEGQELFDWYMRSPADVEAEQGAAWQAKYDAFVKGIGGASPSSEAPSAGFNNAAGGNVGQASYDDGNARLIKAYYRPAGPVVAPPVMAPPSGPQAGPSLDARGGPAIGGTRSGFFGTHDYSPALGGYYTDLPSPLNTVTPKANPNWFELGDGSLVQRDEVERIYAEQQRRLKGQDEPPPPTPTRVVDNLPDGRIPRADQLAKGDRELDPTCAPYGGWERDPNFNGYSQRTKQYETQVTRAPGLDYVVRAPGQKPVKFDGCAVWDPRHPLLEAKGPGYAPLIARALKSTFYPLMRDGDIGQANRQGAAAVRQRIEWHVAEPAAFNYFNGVTRENQPPIVVQVTPPR